MIDLTCPVCGGEPEVCAELGSHEWVTCPECGTEMRPAWKKCTDCGAPLAADDPPEYEPDDSESQRIAEEAAAAAQDYAEQAHETYYQPTTGDRGGPDGV
jgi:rRNA maturation protein Nop10